MLQIKDRISVNITIDGKELPFRRMNKLVSMQISAGSVLALPMVHIQYVDSMEWVSKSRCLYDGAVIDVSVTPVDKESRVYSFRLNSFKENRQSETITYDIDGYLNYPRYWSQSSTTQMEGSSSAVLQHIAETCGWASKDVDVESTADTQLWIPRNRRYHEWARYVAERGYSTETSCMTLAVDPEFGFRYRDLMKDGAASARFGLAVLAKDTILVSSYKPKTSSGLMNKQLGYNMKYVEQKPLSTDPFRSHQRIDVNQSQGTLMMNGTIKKGLEAGRIRIGPIDPGNVNENYERGLYQNKRAASLFGVTLDVLTPFVTNVGLLDRVEFTAPTTVDYLRPYSTQYHVANRCIVVREVDYFEKFTLVTTSLNEEYDTPTYSGSGSLFEDVGFAP